MADIRDPATANNSTLSSKMGQILGKFVPAQLYQYFAGFAGNTVQRNGAAESAHLDSLLPANHPNLFMGSLTEAVQYAKSSFKFLVVYFHSEIHQDKLLFVNQVLCNQTVIDLLNRNFVFWGGDVSLPGPSASSYQLSIDGFPALCVYSPSTFVPRTHMAVLNQANIQLPLSLYRLADTCNNTDLDDVVHMLSNVVEQYAGWITAVRRSQRETEANRQLLVDQDAAYRNALAADEARANEEAEAERRQAEEARLEAQRAEEIEAEERRIVEEAVANRNRSAQRLGEEPAEGPEIISITFRAVDSSRVTRRFHEGEPVERLYDFCRTLESTPATFSLATPYPRRTLSNMQQVLKELNINKALLTIEPA